jgi:hypothetical protein
MVLQVINEVDLNNFDILRGIIFLGDGHPVLKSEVVWLLLLLILSRSLLLSSFWLDLLVLQSELRCWLYVKTSIFRIGFKLL